MKDECIYCGENCVCESYILWNDVCDINDENAELKGFLETKSLTLYVSGFHPKGIKGIEIPALIMEILDEEISTAEYKVMKPVDFINLTKEQSDKLRAFVSKQKLEEQKE